MTGNNYVDKVYLALELTKIAYPSDKVCLDSDNRIYITFQYFLQKLTGVDNLLEVEEYKKEIENLKKQYLLLSSENKKLKLSYNINIKSNIISIKKYINDNGGNMEPDVKTQLLKLLDTIFD